MSQITNLRVDRNNITAHFDTDDVHRVNMLRRSMLTEIETYAIDEVTFHINTSARVDEIIALRLGQLVIDHYRFQAPDEGDFKTRIDVQGPLLFTSDHIPGIPFTYTTPIAELKDDQRILCDVVVKLGTADIHAKWCPISKFSYKRLERGFDITIKSVGMLPPEVIFEQGLAKMQDASNQVPDNIFFRQVIPINI